MLDFNTSTAPWFYVAALAGAFTVIGALVSALGTWVNELIKSKRATKAAIVADLAGLSDSLLKATDSVRDVALYRLPRSDLDYRPHWESKMPKAVTELAEATRQFRFNGPKKLVQGAIARDLIEATGRLASPVFTSEEITLELSSQRLAARKFLNESRRLRGLKPLTIPKATDHGHKAIENHVTDMMKVVADAYARPEAPTELQKLAKESSEPTSHPLAEKKSTPDESAPASDPDKS
ncbi:hypothetical protein [Rathayibacter sp. AY1C4]|uniref:hypothetical protein n=1 Tax=Rathayibacter sp. AY1C4 TaxID=2080537 RepID=UPI0011AFDA14|nr:hypothetical protein [Rathayibacter sp. AY1C4]